MGVVVIIAALILAGCGSAPSAPLPTCKAAKPTAVENCIVVAVSEHRATIRWQRDDGDFRKGRYSRAHSWTFDGGAVVAGSPSPAVVPAPFSDPSAVDPEEAFVAAIASCHMLTFLHLASRAGFDVLSYEDDAVGTMTRNEQRVQWVSRVELSPRIVWRDAPDDAQQDQLHHDAHAQCFIANSVKTEIVVRR
jgi:organic hydroperoxide reductase OsmC/OhrA